MSIVKLNESYSLVKHLSYDQLQKLKVYNENSKFNYKAQMNSYYQYEYFYKQIPEGFIIPNGLLEFLGLESRTPIPEDLKHKLRSLITSATKLKPREFQINAIIDSLFYKRNFIRAATGAGKSLIIGLIAKLLVESGLRGFLIVPNVSLTNQFKNDLIEYDLGINFTVIGGGKHESVTTERNSLCCSDGNVGTSNDTRNDRISGNFGKHGSLTVITWQSLKNFKNLSETLKNTDFLIIDEAHGAKADVIYSICNTAVNTKYKIGLTGTIPEGLVNTMKLRSIFGDLRNYVSPRDLISQGLATEAKIKLVELSYPVRITGDYSEQLKIIKEFKPRTELIAKLAESISKNGNTLVLFQHTLHGLGLFYEVLKQRHLSFTDKTYKDLNFQKDANVFFINGSITGQQREIIRNLLENVENAILIANYATTSTGVNIKKLSNLIFASPLKSYVTITQSLGRLLRTHESKSIVNVFDIVDDSVIFKKHSRERIEKSYRPEGYTIEKLKFKLT